MMGAILLGVTLLCGAGQDAAGGENLPYDPGSVETIRGRVARVDRIAHPTGSGLHLILRTDAGEDVPVALGPAHFVERAFPIGAGDHIEITGARVVRGKRTFVASEVKKDGRVLRLRDRYGVPVWKHGGTPASASTR